MSSSSEDGGSRKREPSKTRLSGIPTGAGQAAWGNWSKLTIIEAAAKSDDVHDVLTGELTQEDLLELRRKRGTPDGTRAKDILPVGFRSNDSFDEHDEPSSDEEKKKLWKTCKRYAKLKKRIRKARGRAAKIVLKRCAADVKNFVLNIVADVKDGREMYLALEKRFGTPSETNRRTKRIQLERLRLKDASKIQAFFDKVTSLRNEINSMGRPAEATAVLDTAGSMHLLIIKMKQDVRAWKEKIGKIGEAGAVVCSP